MRHYCSKSFQAMRYPDYFDDAMYFQLPQLWKFNAENNITSTSYLPPICLYFHFTIACLNCTKILTKWENLQIKSCIGNLTSARRIELVHSHIWDLLHYWGNVFKHFSIPLSISLKVAFYEYFICSYIWVFDFSWDELGITIYHSNYRKSTGQLKVTSFI